ncbi:hypothetical protein [uncultured Dokdonia sp.]|uniref:hypothetical protein n=1 Tax=Dokdonia sp. R78006 TaxID=3093866 RepID=UPI00260FAFCF|nr:hypothetical protein [uncultured Dokdonia sp.]
MRYFIVIVMMLSLVSVEAQGYGNPYGNSGRRRSSVPAPPQTNQGSPEKPDPNILSLERSSVYQEMFELDVFGKEVLRSYLKDYYTVLLAIQDDKDMVIDDKRKKAELEKKKFESQLRDILTEEQVVKIIAEEESGRTQKLVAKKQKKERKKKRKNKGDK